MLQQLVLQFLITKVNAKNSSIQSFSILVVKIVERIYYFSKYKHLFKVITISI